MRPKQIAEENAYPGEVYDMYQGGNATRNSRGSAGSGQPSRQRRYSDEEDGSEYDGSINEGDFEMVGGHRRAPDSVSSRSTRRPEITRIRVKVHADDVKLVMITTTTEFSTLVEKVREKFALRRRFKIKVKDEDMPNGDMITMGDQDDLEMIIDSVKEEARKTRSETGKMEVS